MLTLQSDLHGNHLLGALPSHEWQALAPHLELVHLRTEQLLCDSGQRIHHVYFPTTAIISMLSTMEDGSSVEIAAVGREGMTGVPVLTGGETMPNRVQVQCAGFAYRMSAGTPVMPSRPTAAISTELPSSIVESIEMIAVVGK
jgi:hypothetical protein